MEHLRMDQGPSLGHIVNYYGCDEYFMALRSLPEAVRKNQSAFTLEHGMRDMFEYMNQIGSSPYDKNKQFKGSSSHMLGSDGRRRELAECYNNSQAVMSRLRLLPDVKGIPNVYNVYPWSTCKKVLDAGGSTGYFLASILKQPGCQHIEGFVADLPAVVDKALQNYLELGVPEGRIAFLKQDLTQRFPEDFQVDTLILKHFLDAFDVETTIKILRNCRSVVPKEGGKILVITTCVTDAGVLDKNTGVNGIQPGVLALHAAFLFNGAFKTRSETVKYFKSIENRSGFRLSEIYETFLGGDTIFELSCM